MNNNKWQQVEAKNKDEKTVLAEEDLSEED